MGLSLIEKSSGEKGSGRLLLVFSLKKESAVTVNQKSGLNIRTN